MKIRFLFLLTLLLLVATFVSCNLSGEGETTPATEEHMHVTPTFRSMKEYHEYIDQKYVDRAVSHKPTREDAIKVTEGMLSADVFEILGKPHGYGDYASCPSMKWYLADNGVCYMTFRIPDDYCKGCWPDKFDLAWEFGAVASIEISDPQ